MLIAIGFLGPSTTASWDGCAWSLIAAAISAPDRRIGPRIWACTRAATLGWANPWWSAIAEGRKCARIVNKDLGGSPMDADREQLALGAWSGDSDRTLRREAEAAGTLRPEEFFTGPGHPGAVTARGSAHDRCGEEAAGAAVRSDRGMVDPMVRTAVLGLPRIGSDRELKFAVEAYWAGRLPASELRATARAQRAGNWQRARAGGST